MTLKEKINEAKVIYDIEISAILKDKNRWKKFLDFSSGFYKYTFMENLLMFAQKPNVTMCATLEQWNSVGRWVNRGAKALKIINNQDDEIYLKYVFDVKDTHGDAKVLFRKWESNEDQVVHILKNYFKYEEKYHHGNSTCSNCHKHVIDCRCHICRCNRHPQIIKSITNQ